MKPEIILADPPWCYNFAPSASRKIENQYPTMDELDICRYEFPCADNAVLYLWATAPKLPLAVRVMEAWGFTYKSCAVWNKVRVGMGYWFRGVHELLLVGVKGHYSPPAPADRVPSIFTEVRGQHSAKPLCVYEMIERSFPSAPKLELFARFRRPGWEAMGNELPVIGA